MHDLDASPKLRKQTQCESKQNIFRLKVNELRVRSEELCNLYSLIINLQAFYAIW